MCLRKEGSIMHKPFCWAIPLATLLLGASRVLLLPVVAGDGRMLTHASYPLLFLMVAVTVVLLFYGRAREEYTALSSGQRSLFLLGALFGGVLMLASLWDVVRFALYGITPPPVSLLVNSIERFLFFISALAGLLGGLFVCLRFGSLLVHTDYSLGYGRLPFSEGWLWLLLPLWGAARLARYNMVYASLVDISPALYELLLYGVMTLFLYEAARFFSNVDAPSRYFRGLAAATAALCLAASLSRGVLFLLGEQVAVAYCAIPSVIEAALGAFATVLAITMKEQTGRHYKS